MRRIAPFLLIAVCGCARSPKSLVRNWSDPATWGGHVPGAGQHVVIPKGTTVVLDVPVAEVGFLDVEGDLVIGPGQHRLQAETIGVWGSLTAGTVTRPHQDRLEIVLDARRVENKDAGMLLVGGTLDLHGSLEGPGWTRLASTVRPGDQTLTLRDKVKWVPGSEVHVAPTGFDPRQAERARWQAGRLEAPVAFSHFGAVAQGVDESAEVACLTRNIVITSLTSTTNPHHGGSLKVSVGARARLESVEFVHMGQEGVKGGYPLHFHLVGDAKESYVRRCAIHDSYNRGLTVHGTHNLKVDDLVVADSIGHLIFIEDGIESGNQFHRCLALGAHNAVPSKAILTSDITASGFWVTRPGNSFTDCAAAGCDGQGFWLAFPKHPTGPSANPRISPREEDLGAFVGNVAHSNLHNGLFVDGEPNPPGVFEVPNYVPKRAAIIDSFTAFKNAKRGVWLRGANFVVRRARLADQPIGLTFAASRSVFEDSLVVGETENGGTTFKPELKGFPVRGFEFYDGQVGVRNVTFRNFQPNKVREAGALSVLRFSPFFLDPRNYAEGLKFENAKPVYFEHVPQIKSGSASADGYRTAVFIDRDGSVTGRPESRVAVANPFLIDASCDLNPEWNAVVTQQSFAHLWVEISSRNLLETGSLRISRVDAPRAYHTMAGTPEEGKGALFQANLLANRSYFLNLRPEQLDGLRLSVQFAQPGETFEFRLPKPPVALQARENLARHQGPLLAPRDCREHENRLIVRLVANRHGQASALLGAVR